jgi:ketosteroid isomerase-like protein
MRNTILTGLKGLFMASIVSTQAMAAPPASGTAANKAAVQASFNRWVDGTGSPFDLLEPTASWTIVGSSPLSKTYDSRQQFMDEVIKPFNARMKSRLVPTMRGLYADDDTVVIFFDANATAKDGKPYHNTYTWYFQMQQQRVVNVVAFFDTREFDEFWDRVAP